MPIALSLKLPTLSAISFKPFTNLAIRTAIPLRVKVLIKSSIPLKFALPILSTIPPSRPPSNLPMALPMVVTIFHKVCKNLKKLPLSSAVPMASNTRTIPSLIPSATVPRSPILSLILSNRVWKVSRPGEPIFSLIKPKNFLSASPTILRTSPILFIPLVNILVSLTVSLSLTSQSPILAVTPSIPPPRSSRPPNKGEIALNTATNACFIMLSMANKPLNVRLSLSDAESLSFNLAVNSFRAFVNAASRSAVIGGKISRNASFIGLTTDPIASQTFQKDSMRSSRPPSSFHPESISLRASAPLAKTSYIALAKSVHNSVASSASPNIMLKVFIHPVLTASFTESIASPKVLAF